MSNKSEYIANAQLATSRKKVDSSLLNQRKPLQFKSETSVTANPNDPKTWKLI